MSELKIGDSAPDFKAITSQGDISLKDFDNKNIILYFYPKDLTPGCSLQAHDFTSMYDEFQKLGTQIIGVSSDTPELHDKFCSTIGIPYPLIADTERKLCELYGVIEEKSMFGKKYMGISRSTFLIGKDRSIIKIWKKVKPIRHASEVFNLVKNLAL